jgi:hypothetical protein
VDDAADAVVVRGEKRRGGELKRKEKDRKESWWFVREAELLTDDILLGVFDCDRPWIEACNYAMG